MEILLKLHGLESGSFRDIQDRYGNTNIGFERLADMLPYGIKAADEEQVIEKGFAKIEEETRHGRFPLVSLPGASKWHIWVAVMEADKLRFLSRDYQNPSILEIPDCPGLRHTVATYRQGKVHYAIYDTIKK